MPCVGGCACIPFSRCQKGVHVSVPRIATILLNNPACQKDLVLVRLKDGNLYAPVYGGS